MAKCPGWSVYAGSCVLEKGHPPVRKGEPHKDKYGDSFKASKRGR